MTHPNGGFYSALDADSEGVEGKFYTWRKTELQEILGADEPLISSYYGVKDQGNWEHGSNILIRHKEEEQFLSENSITPDVWNNILVNAKEVLLSRRGKRIRPGLDDKIIAGWNAMMVCGLTDAYRVFADSKFLQAALNNIHFIERELMEGNKLYRSYKNKRSNTSGFLDDYAYVIQAFIKMYQVTFDEHWIIRASEMMEYTLAHFFDSTDGFFFYTSTESEPLISRKKEIFDNVIPSSNAMMAQNLNYLSVYFDRDDWRKTSISMTDALSHLIKEEAGYMSHWAIVYTEIKKGLAEIVFAGKNIDELRARLQQNYFPFSLVQGTEDGSQLPLLKGKTAIDGKTTIYVCYNKTCKLPVHTVEAAKQQLI
jgi:hypothetical protein